MSTCAICGGDLSNRYYIYVNVFTGEVCCCAKCCRQATPPEYKNRSIDEQCERISAADHGFRGIK